MDKNKEKTLPDIHEIIGDFGRWQKEIYAIFFFTTLLNAWQNLSITFLAPKLDFLCSSLPSSNESYLIPGDSFENYTVSNDQCYIIMSDENNTIPCTQWEFNLTSHQRTIISDWNLVCHREWLISLSKSIYMVGYMVSILVMSQLSDWFGRFPIIWISFIIVAVSSLLTCIPVSYNLFIVLRFFAGFGRTGLSTTAFVYLMEILSPKWRGELGFGLQLSWSFGFMALPGIALLITDWVYLQLAISLPILFLGVIYWLVPESPRWLLTQKKWDKFDQVISKAAKKNGYIIDSDIYQKVKENKKDENVVVKKKSIIDVMKQPKLRFRLIALFFIWIVNSFIYYELALNTNDLAGNHYLNFFLSGLVEIPGILLFTFAIRKFGRRLSLSLGMVAVGIFCAAMIFVPTDLNWLTVTFAMLAKLCITGTYQTVYLCTAELFPTIVRNATLGYCSTFARLGPILAPFVGDLGKATHAYVPNLLNAILSVCAGVLMLFFPETKDKRIPDVLESENKGSDDIEKSSLKLTNKVSSEIN